MIFFCKDKKKFTKKMTSIKTKNTNFTNTTEPLLKIPATNFIIRDMFVSFDAFNDNTNVRCVRKVKSSDTGYFIHLGSSISDPFPTILDTYAISLILDGVFDKQFLMDKYLNKKINTEEVIEKFNQKHDLFSSSSEKMENRYILPLTVQHIVRVCNSENHFKGCVYYKKNIYSKNPSKIKKVACTHEVCPMVNCKNDDKTQYEHIGKKTRTCFRFHGEETTDSFFSRYIMSI